MRRLDEQLCHLRQSSTGCDQSVSHRLKAIDAKIANIRKAVEDGLPDADWAYSRLDELIREREALSQGSQVIGGPPRIDVNMALAYRARAEKLMVRTDNSEKKQVIRSSVDRITLAPDISEVEIAYKIPEAISAYSGSGRIRCSELYPTLTIHGVRVKTGRGKARLKS